MDTSEEFKPEDAGETQESEGATPVNTAERELPAVEATPEAPGEALEMAATVPEAAQSASVQPEELLAQLPETAQGRPQEDSRLRAILEAIVYVAEEPVTAAQLAASLGEPKDRIQGVLDELAAEFEKPEHGLAVREVAGGYKMATKAEHHEVVRAFVKSLKPPLKLSLAALETLAVVAYKQPATAPEIMEIRGVQGAGVLKTLMDRKLIAPAGRKNVIGKPILYKTTKEFLLQFGLKDLSELPTLKEFEELRRLAVSEEPAQETGEAAPQAETAAGPTPPEKPVEESTAEPESPSED